MRFRVVALVVPVLLLVLAAPAEGREAALTWSPDPVPADTPVTVHLSVPEGARNATLKTCLAEEGIAQFCFPLQAMTPSDAGGFQATTDRRWGFPAGQQIGFNVTWVDAENVTHHHPEGEPDPARAYVFFTTLPAERGAPAPGALFALAAVGLAARWLRGRQ